MYCQIIPNNVLLKVAEELGDVENAKRIRLLENIQESIKQRYQRSVVYNNRSIFMPSLMSELITGKERLWFYDCRNSFNLPKYPEKKMEQEHEDDKPAPRPQEIVPQLHMHNMDETHDFFRDVYGRRSFDGRSATVKFFSNYGDGFDNAFWDGRQMVFGNGGRYFNDFGSYIDVVAHEFTHAITQYTSNLKYMAQSGALNEHVSDVFGSLVKQYLSNQKANQADWLIGAGLFDRRLSKEFKALRSMKEPGTASPGDTQPDHMSNLYTGPEDNEGVHINSGIPNKAFYLAATKIENYAWKHVGIIWLKTLEDRTMIPPTAHFTQFAKATVEKAKEIFPQYTSVAIHIKDSWEEVGVTW